MSAFIPPDWRDASAYPAKVDDWLLGQWVWAFLRRNPEYQKDYEHFSKLPSHYTNGVETSKWCAKSTCDDDGAELRYCKHPILPGEAVGEYFARTGDETPYYYSIEAHLMEKWEINCIADPAYDGGSHCIAFEILLPKVIGGEYVFDHEKDELKPKEPEAEELHEITLRFDLRYSIDTQLSYAKDHLIQCRKSLEQEGIMPIEKIHKSGINKKFLPKYLRAYDAYQTEATNLEIAKYLWPERKIVTEKSKYDADNSRDANEQLAQRATTKGIELVMGGYKEFLKLL